MCDKVINMCEIYASPDELMQQLESARPAPLFPAANLGLTFTSSHRCKYLLPGCLSENFTLSLEVELPILQLKLSTGSLMHHLVTQLTDEIEDLQKSTALF
jgi:hypothetical protein